jgi:hypothetical protein
VGIRFPGFTKISHVGIFALVLAVSALLLILAAEWPRISERVGTDAWAARSRRKRRDRLTVIEGEGDDDFAASVERDLANLPVTPEPDDRSRH